MVLREKQETKDYTAGARVVKQHGEVDGPGSRQLQNQMSHPLPGRMSVSSFIVPFIQHDKCHHDISFDGTPDLGHSNLMKHRASQSVRSRSPRTEARPMF